MGLWGSMGWLVILSPGEQRGLMCTGPWELLPRKARSLGVGLLAPTPTCIMGN